MPLRSSALTIGTYRFDIPDTSAAHTVEEIALGPSGEVDYVMSDWSDGLATIEDGIEYRPGTKKLVASTGQYTAFPGAIELPIGAIEIAVKAGSAALPSSPVRTVVFAGAAYIAAGRYVYKLDATPEWEQVLDLGVGISASDLIVHDGRIGVAYVTGYQHSANGTVWANVATAVDRWGVLNDKLYRAVRPNTVYAGTGSFADAWDSGTEVGDTSYSIQSIQGVDPILFVAKEDGVYTYDSLGTVISLTPDMRVVAGSSVGDLQATCSFDGSFYFRTNYEFIRIDGSLATKERVGFNRLLALGKSSPSVTAVAVDDGYLYAIDTRVSSAVLTILRMDSRGQWQGFGYIDVSASPFNYVTLSPQTLGLAGFLYLFGIVDTGAATPVKCFRFYLPTSPDPDQDFITGGDRQFATTSGYCQLPRLTGTGSVVSVEGVTVDTSGCSANITVAVYASVDGAAAVQIGSSITSNPSTTVRPTNPLIGNYVDVRLFLTTNATTSSPHVLGLRVHGRWHPGVRRIHTYLVLADSYHTAPRGGSVRENPVTTIGNLQTLETSNAYQTITDENVQSFTGIVEKVGRQLLSLRSLGIQEPGHVVKVTIVEKM